MASAGCASSLAHVRRVFNYFLQGVVKLWRCILVVVSAVLTTVMVSVPTVSCRPYSILPGFFFPFIFPPCHLICAMIILMKLLSEVEAAPGWTSHSQCWRVAWEVADDGGGCQNLLLSGEGTNGLQATSSDRESAKSPKSLEAKA